MKKIILIIFISLMFSNIGFAGMRDIAVVALQNKHISTLCVDGYKFIIYDNKRGSGMVQAFEERNGKSLPAKC